MLANELANAGKFDEAIAQYQEAVQRDPNFGRAYCRLGDRRRSAPGGRTKPTSCGRKRSALMERMTEREKYRTLGAYYLGPGANDEQAARKLSCARREVSVRRPGPEQPGGGVFSTCSTSRAASKQGQKAAEVYPKQPQLPDQPRAVRDVRERLHHRRGRSAARPSPSSPFDKAYLPIAMAAMAAGKPDEALAAYVDMAKVSTRGASIASMGRADLAMYQGRYDDARKELEAGAASDDAGKLRGPARAEADRARGSCCRHRQARRGDEARRRGTGRCRPPTGGRACARLLIGRGRSRRSGTKPYVPPT